MDEPSERSILSHSARDFDVCTSPSTMSRPIKLDARAHYLFRSNVPPSLLPRNLDPRMRAPSQLFPQSHTRE